MVPDRSRQAKKGKSKASGGLDTNIPSIGGLSSHINLS